MDRVMHRAVTRRGREPTFARGHGLEIIGAVIGVAARREMAPPMMVEMNARNFEAEMAEGMKMGGVRAAPALEFDAELERDVRRYGELGWNEARVPVGFGDRSEDGREG